MIYGLLFKISGDLCLIVLNYLTDGIFDAIKSVLYVYGHFFALVYLNCNHLVKMCNGFVQTYRNMIQILQVFVFFFRGDIGVLHQWQDKFKVAWMRTQVVRYDMGKIKEAFILFYDQEDARGIGLFMTKNQVESLDGKIEVFSEPNVGTTFKITF